MRKIAYKMKICEKCGEEFKPTASTQKWCEKCLLKICLNCGKEFKVRNKAKFDSSLFCSAQCRVSYLAATKQGENAPNYRNGNRLKIDCKCDMCGKAFKKEKGQVNKWKNHFCGRECYIKYLQIEENKKKGKDSPKYSQVDAICDWCGKKFKSYKSTASKARFCSLQCRNDWQSDMMKGSKHYNWKGGKTEKRHLDMISREYKAWRRAVFQRDHYTCQICGDNRGGNLRAHHIKSYSEHPELKHDVENGVTLCEKCHIKVHSKLDIQSDPQI